MNLIVQPEAGLAPVVRAIKRARRNVDIAIFRTDREEIEKALGAAVQRGVKVRVLVAHTNSGGENRLRKLEQRLLEAGATVTRTGDDFVRYHGKFMVADNTLHLFGFNFTKVDTIRSRSFGVSTRDKSAVREALALFDADSSRQPFVPKRTHLVVSPENAREALTAFIKGAKRQLLIYDVNVQDRALIKLLEQQASAGVEVRVIGKCKGGKGITVLPLRGMRLHVRAMVRDGSRAFVGSQSLRRLELDQRREVGVLITNGVVARQIRDTFEADWAESESAAA
ncbi:MAG TPA: phospholipase D-like domain-containing protein [Vicinamibacterales bacterium]|jgi:phosphatidylserine/phosphatidylglycerophosphate/cardiolipin synthase-like enzyme|nr:phospholipase D-like domain-containing protein [Vicinamibacterales bacterium]